MLVQGQTLHGEGSTIPVESHHTPTSAPSTSQPPTSPPSMQTTHDVEDPAPMPHDSPLSRDPSKQQRIITEIDQNPSISLVQDEGTSWIQEDAEIQGRTSADTEILLDQEEPTELVEDLGSGEKGEKEISTANVPMSTANAILEVSAAGPSIVSTAGPSSSTTDVFEDEMMTIAKSLVAIRRTRPRTTSVKERAAQEEASKAAIDEELDDIQAMIEADKQMVARLQSEEQEKYIIEEKARMLVKMIAERKKFFAAQRAAEIRSRPPTKAQVRNRMCTYMKNQAGYTHKQLKGRSYDEIQKLFDKAYKQKLEDEAEKEELRACLDIAPGDEVAMDVESLATKYPIVDWKTHILTENMMYYQIIRADGSSKNYKIFSEMLDDFDRQDVMDLHRLVQERMLRRRLEVDHESEMAFELLRFTRSQLKE
ncbi:hypothetical protein Tco_0817178 [Tanacetum coccineum]